MPSAPWWVSQVVDLSTSAPTALGPLWRLRERLAYVRANVVLAELEEDFTQISGARAAWDGFEAQERATDAAFAREGERCATEVRSGSMSKTAFRASWEALGFQKHEESGGTPADDHLDGLLHLSRHTEFMAPAPNALLNLATRASRVADFLSVCGPGEDDVVFDLGSGSGKLAITVAASAATQVLGVEIEPTYSEEASRSSQWLGLSNVRFETADVRDVDLARGSIFYLYYPFHGSLAKDVAGRLGSLAREKAISLYVAGPSNQFGEYFQAQVAAGALTLRDTRGEFGEVLVLESARG